MANTSPTFVKALVAGLIAGGVAAVANLVYFFVYKTAAGMESTGMIEPASTIVSSLIPVVLASLGWFGLTRLIPKQANLIFIVVVAALALLSLGGSFQASMPDGSPAPAGFAGLSAPMHIIASLAAILLIPRRAPMA